MKQSWQFVGIELEGAWDDVSSVIPFFKADGSVRVPGYQDSYYCPFLRPETTWESRSEFDKALLRHRMKFAKLSGEIASPKLKNKKEIKEFIFNNYPNKTDWSAGYHIHISFNNLYAYAALMTPSFHSEFLRMMNKFGDAHGYTDKETEYNYWNRFQGNNSYCQKSYSPLPYQATKYRLINYQSFTHDRRTFEIRAFPAFIDKKIALKASEAFLKLVEDYLANWLDKDSEEIKNNVRILKGYLRDDEALKATA